MPQGPRLTLDLLMLSTISVDSMHDTRIGGRRRFGCGMLQDRRVSGIYLVSPWVHTVCQYTTGLEGRENLDICLGSHDFL